MTLKSLVLIQNINDSSFISLATQEVFEVDAAALQSVAQTSQSPTTSIAKK